MFHKKDKGTSFFTRIAYLVVLLKTNINYITEQTNQQQQQQKRINVFT